MRDNEIQRTWEKKYPKSWNTEPPQIYSLLASVALSSTPNFRIGLQRGKRKEKAAFQEIQVSLEDHKAEAIEFDKEFRWL